MSSDLELHHVAELIRLLPIGVALLDKEMNYLAASQTWIDLFTQGERIAGTAVGTHAHQSHPNWREPLERALEGHSTSATTSPYDKPNGEKGYLNWRVDPWRSPSGDVAGIAIFADDISENAVIRQQLEEKEMHLANLFEHSPIGLNLCRMDGLWLESNQAFLDIIGYSAEEADGGLTYWELTPRKYDDQEKIQLEHLATTKRYGPYEKEFIRKDGRLVPVRLHGFIVEREGEQFIWSLIEDITERKKLEEALEKERMGALQASRLTTLGEMAAGIAHEINNPLAIIQAYSQVVEMAARKDDKELLGEAAEAIQDAVKRASHIVTGLLRFAREPSRIETRPSSPQELIDEALSLTQARLRNHGVVLQLDVNCSRPILCNPVEFSQVLINLINNGFDAVRSQDERWLRIETGCDEHHLTIQVSDSGPGIPKDVASDLFTPFFTTKEVGKGTGLGLSISKGIIESYEGSLRLLDGTPNTTFEIRMPIYRD